MDTRRLSSFVRVVDGARHIARPALSRQSVFGRQLLSRSEQGVEPTEAGRALYRHARVIPSVSGPAEVLRAKGLVVDLP